MAEAFELLDEPSAVAFGRFGVAAVEELFGELVVGDADKTLPCGTKVIFVYNGRAIEVPVIDRGRYIPGREWDLTGATAEALDFPGRGSIQWRLAELS